MLTDAQQDYLAGAVRPMQIIIGALAAGVMTFLVIALAVRIPENPTSPLLSYIAFGFAVASLAGWVLVPGVIASRARQSIARGRSPLGGPPSAVAAKAGIVGQLAAVFQTRLIIANALLEGAAFFNLIAFMLERQALGLGTAAVLLLLILSQIPTRNRLQDWVSHELETIEQMTT